MTLLRVAVVAVGAIVVAATPSARPVTILLSRALATETDKETSVKRPGLLRGQLRTDSEHLQYSGHVFFGPVGLGDGQQLSVLFDTGSGNLVVPSPACISPGCTNHHRFHPEESSFGGFDGNRSTLELSYGTGHVSGSGFEGEVCLGDACGHAGFVVAGFLSDEFRKYKFDGILGLGLPRQSAGPSYNILDALVRSGSLPARMFALALRLGDNSSVITLGGYDTAGMASGEQIAWLPADSRHGEWAVPLADVIVDGSKLGACGAGGCRAIIDSGSSSIGLPATAVRRLKQQLEPLDCGQIDALPTIGFILGNGTYNVGPRSYVEVSSSDSMKCRLLINALDEFSTRTVLLGHVFLLGHYAIFDQEHLRIGLARAASDN